MKALFPFLSLLLLLSISSCDLMYDESDEPTMTSDEFGSGPAVDPFDPNDVDDHIGVEDGTSIKGRPPHTSNIRYPPKIFNHRSGVTTTKDQFIFLPFEYQCSPHASGPEKVLVQIKGASAYWSVKLAPSSPHEGDAVLTLLLPGNIQNGTFTVDYRLVDDFGYVSNVLSTEIHVIDIGGCDGSVFSGSDGLTVRSFDMGHAANKVRVTYDMHTIPDRIDVFYDGQWVGGTGRKISYSVHPPKSQCYDGTDGYVGGSRFFDIDYDPVKSRRLDVYISGCLGGNTAWDVWVECL